ncbi:hypothetical protein ASU31_00715 [Pedobacter ginsenosidimutans]|uniref:Galactose-binding protein n=1 Tax=Pedobacter ginsenosidimutans TaxID=687842 RepID=A0A0T5VVG2_9SPHI|nr:DUF4959 domain-containing protein [Pedobacter ginsenosidimutans]KRT17850.1 hypothetical protein ASU31_00715 [Pedobacter ginsenosidimutans]
MKILNISPVLLASILLLNSCKESLEFKELGSEDKSVPGVVSNVSVENMSGKAKISYTIPSSKNLLYVKAVYKLKSGENMEVKSSAYNNSLIVEGFADTLVHDISLISVSKAEIGSDPVIVKIRPLEAPIWKVFRSVNIVNAFGGYNLSALNPNRGNISILVMKKNAVKEFEVDNQKSVFTSTDEILSKIRGLDTLENEFAFFVKDRWGNSTDTLFKKVKPIFEMELSKSRFKVFPLPGDAPAVSSGEVYRMWDGRLGWPNTSFTNQVSGGPNPHIISFDTGVLAKLSRVWIRPYPEGTRFYYLSTMKKFEIYGSANPSLTGALDASWTLLGSYEVTKPSGLPYGTDSAEDQALAGAGFSWDVDLSAPKVRYLRIRCLENFAGGTNQSINEIRVFGDAR